MALLVACGLPVGIARPVAEVTPESTALIAREALQSPSPGPTSTKLAGSSGTPTTLSLTETAHPTATLTAGERLSIGTTARRGTRLPFRPKVEVVASNLRIPWALAFAPDGRLFFTERPGRIRVLIDGRLQASPVAELPVAVTGEGGLLGLAVDPDFAQNGHMYVMYTYYGQGTELLNRISRLTLDGDRAADEKVLLENIPGARFHDGGRLKFGPDGKLYATTGDAQSRNLSQELGSLAGKILRLNPDGSIPEDNPFPASLVFSYGHRNPQGLAWEPDSGLLFSTEHGPSGEMGLCCRDEVNRIEPGANYGWPLVTEAAEDPRFVDPVLHSGDDTWAPAGAVFYDGVVLTPWKGHLFFGALRGEHLHRLALGGPGLTEVVAEERLFEGQFGRIRDVVTGPDGYIYFTTSNRDGRGFPAAEDDRILRVIPGT